MKVKNPEDYISEEAEADKEIEAENQYCCAYCESTSKGLEDWIEYNRRNNDTK